MDLFSASLDGLNLAGQVVMHILFTGRLTGKKSKIWHFVLYFFLLCVIWLVSSRFSLSGTPSVIACVLALYATSRFGMGNQRLASWLCAVLAFYISQLSFGIVNSVEAAFFPRFIGRDRKSVV